MRDQLESVLSGRERWTVLHADCLEALPLLPDKSVAHVIADPPYEAEAHTLARRQRQAGVVGELAISFGKLDETTRIGASVQFVRVARRWLLAFCQVEAIWLWRAAMEAAGGRWVRGQVWVKPDSAPQFTGDRPAQGFECIATAYAGEGRMAWNAGGARGVYTFEIGTHGGPKNDHPTQKPIELMLELIRRFTDPDEIILDPFCGSGTTGVACLRLGRRFIGIEKDAKYAALSRERLEAESRGLSLRDARAGQLPMFAESTGAGRGAE